MSLKYMQKRQETAGKSTTKTFRRFPASSYIDQQNTIVRLWHFADFVTFKTLILCGGQAIPKPVIHIPTSQIIHGINPKLRHTCLFINNLGVKIQCISIRGIIFCTIYIFPSIFHHSVIHCCKMFQNIRSKKGYIIVLLGLSY